MMKKRAIYQLLLLSVFLVSCTSTSTKKKGRKSSEISQQNSDISSTSLTSKAEVTSSPVSASTSVVNPSTNPSVNPTSITPSTEVPPSISIPPDTPSITIPTVNYPDCDWAVINEEAKENFWLGVDGNKRGDDIRQELRDKVWNSMSEKISGFPSSISYKSNGGVAQYFEGAYRSPYNQDKMVRYYSDAESGSYNKEHIWPNSRGAGEGSGCPGDPWVISPCLTSDNSGRGNNVYGIGTSCYDPGKDAQNAKEFYRGIASRAILYTATVWWKNPGKNSKFLELVDDPTYVAGDNKMGMLSQMLIWNIQYDVSPHEIIRNEYLYETMGSRNPFVDHREYACKIWAGRANATAQKACQQYLGV